MSAKEDMPEVTEMLEKQQKDIEEILTSVSYYDHNLCIMPGATSGMISYSADALRKSKTAYDLILNQKYSEACILIRNILEQVFMTIYLAENSKYWYVFFNHMYLNELEFTAGYEGGTPDSRFNITIEQLFDEVGSDDYKNLYDALSATEAHVGLSPLRESFASEEPIKGVLYPEYNRHESGMFLYLLYHLTDKLYNRVIDKAIYYKTSEPENIENYESRRDNEKEILDQIYQDMDGE